MDQLIDKEDQLSNFLHGRRKLTNKLKRGVSDLPVNNGLCTPSMATDKYIDQKVSFSEFFYYFEVVLLLH